jgi:hypothetical protein
MSEVRQGRWTAKIDGDFVVFIIGARLDLRNPVRSLIDLGGRRGLPHMLKYLSEGPDSGLLAFETHGLTTIQYWRSFDHLERFARNEDDPHLDAWRKYWKRLGRSPRTGIWHETFLVRAGEYEAVYGNMPPLGLAKAGESIPLSADATARRRLKKLSG